MRVMHLRHAAMVVAICILATARVLAAADAGNPTISPGGNATADGWK